MCCRKCNPSFGLHVRPSTPGSGLLTFLERPHLPRAQSCCSTFQRTFTIKEFAQLVANNAQLHSGTFSAKGVAKISVLPEAESLGSLECSALCLQPGHLSGLCSLCQLSTAGAVGCDPCSHIKFTLRAMLVCSQSGLKAFLSTAYQTCVVLDGDIRNLSQKIG